MIASQNRFVKRLTFSFVCAILKAQLGHCKRPRRHYVQNSKGGERLVPSRQEVGHRQVDGLLEGSPADSLNPQPKSRRLSLAFAVASAFNVLTESNTIFW